MDRRGGDGSVGGGCVQEEGTPGQQPVAMAHSGVWRERPKLAIHIAHVSQIWALIEAELALVFQQLSGSSRIAMMSAFSFVLAIHTRLNMITKLADDLFGDDERARWRGIKGRIESAAERRNEIVHGLWCTYEDDVDAVFLSKPVPRRPGDLRLTRYTHPDFVEIENELEATRHELTLFSRQLTLGDEGAASG
jgi:hypothetical protein